jgi:hypothetical protein
MKIQYYDKNGIPILEGDLLRSYHFTGARKRKHYLYKKAIWLKSPYFPDGGLHAVAIDDLDMKPLEECHRCKISHLKYVEVIDGPCFDSPIDGTLVCWRERKQKRSGIPPNPDSTGDL